MDERSFLKNVARDPISIHELQYPIMDEYTELDESPLGPADFGQWKYQASLDRVIDGDTLVLTIDLGFYTVKRDQKTRLIGIDTAEIYGTKKESDEFQRGHEHKAFVERWLAHAAWEYDGTPDDFPLIIETMKDDTGKYGRWLVNVYRKTDGNNLAHDLLDEFGNDILY